MNKIYSNSVTKYLKKNLRPTWKLEWQETNGIHTVVVVPAICEYENIKKLLYSITKNPKSRLENSLLIFVINRQRSSNQEVKSDNTLSLELIRSLINKTATDQNQKQILESGININYLPVYHTYLKLLFLLPGRN